MHEALTEKKDSKLLETECDSYCKTIFCPPAMYKGKAKGKFAGELIILTQWFGRHGP